MKKQFITLSMAAFCATGLAGCHSSPTDLPPGEYSKTSSSVDSNGTETKTTRNTTVLQDANGNKTAVVQSKTTKDPKGLFNKTTTDDSTQIIEDK